MQFRDLKAQYAALKPDIDAAMQDVLTSAAFILGQPVRDLEAELAAYVGRRHCVTCANGTEALQLALMAMDVGPGDAVFTSDFTYFASAGCASVIGATPVFADIDLHTFNMDPVSLEAAIQQTIAEGKLTPKVIIPVDLFGLPADYRAILPIAEKYGLHVLEDAAQGFGGVLDGKRACSFGDVSATSFFPAKPLGCYGDGGAIFTDDDAMAERLRSLRVAGKSPTDKYDNIEIGLNSRLDTLQAAILRVKLKAFSDYELTDVNRAAAMYSERLQDHFQIPMVPEGFYSSWAQYTLLLDSEVDRDALRDKLKTAGIPSMVYYPRGLHQQKAYADRKFLDEQFPNTVAATKQVLSLPIHPYLDEASVDEVVKALLA